MKAKNVVNRNKKGRITLRLDQAIKDNWVLFCENNNILLQDFIVGSVEKKLLNSERKEVLTFIEKQGNIFSKIETNINQIAKTVNTEKIVHPHLFSYYNEQLKELTLLKDEQNKMFKKILAFLAQ